MNFSRFCDLQERHFIKAWKRKQDHFQTLETFYQLNKLFSVQKPWPWCPGMTPAARPATIYLGSDTAERGRGLTASEHPPASGPPLESRPGWHSVAAVKKILVGLECWPWSCHVHY